MEIEIKIPISEVLFHELKDKLSPSFRGNKVQVDDYYTPIHRDFVNREYPFEWLRLRRKGDKSILTYKHFYPEGVEVNTHCDEFETHVEDSLQLEKIFHVLNFKKLVTVENDRSTFVIGDEFEVALDNVKGLGYFIEVEALKNFGSINLAREKLFEFAESLGVDVSNPDKRGYPYLMLKRNGLI